MCSPSTREGAYVTAITSSLTVTAFMFGPNKYLLVGACWTGKVKPVGEPGYFLAS
jgi:hypothetical protein